MKATMQKQNSFTKTNVLSTQQMKEKILSLEEEGIQKDQAIDKATKIIDVLSKDLENATKELQKLDFTKQALKEKNKQLEQEITLLKETIQQNASNFGSSGGSEEEERKNIQTKERLQSEEMINEYDNIIEELHGKNEALEQALRMATDQIAILSNQMNQRDQREDHLNNQIELLIREKHEKTKKALVHPKSYSMSVTTPMSKSRWMKQTSSGSCLGLTSTSGLLSNTAGFYGEDPLGRKKSSKTLLDESRLSVEGEKRINTGRSISWSQRSTTKKEGRDSESREDQRQNRNQRVGQVVRFMCPEEEEKIKIIQYEDSGDKRFGYRETKRCNSLENSANKQMNAWQQDSQIKEFSLQEDNEKEKQQQERKQLEEMSAKLLDITKKYEEICFKDEENTRKQEEKELLARQMHDEIDKQNNLLKQLEISHQQKILEIETNYHLQIQSMLKQLEESEKASREQLDKFLLLEQQLQLTKAEGQLREGILDQQLADEKKQKQQDKLDYQNELRTNEYNNQIQFQSTLQQLQDEIVLLKQTLFAAERANDQLQVLKQEQNKVIDSQTQCILLNKNDFKEHLNTMNNAMESMKSILTNHLPQIPNLKLVDNLDLQSLISLLDQQLSTYNNSNTAFKIKCEDLEREIKANKQEIIKLNDENKEAMNELKILSKHIQMESKRIDQQQQQQFDYLNSNNIIQQNDSNNNNNSQQFVSLQSQHQEGLSQTVKIIQLRLTSILDRMSRQLLGAHEGYNKQFNEFKQQETEQENRIIKLQQQNKQLQSESITLDTTLKNLKNDIYMALRLNTSNNSTSSNIHINKLYSSFENKGISERELILEVDKLVSQIKLQLSANKSLLEESNSLKSDVQLLRKSLNQAQLEYKCNSIFIHTLKQSILQIIEQEKIISDMVEERRDQELKMSELERSKLSMNEKILGMEESFLRSTNNNFINKTVDFERSNELKQKCEQLNQKLQRKKSKLQKARQEISQMSRDKEQLEYKMNDLIVKQQEKLEFRQSRERSEEKRTTRSVSMIVQENQENEVLEDINSNLDAILITLSNWSQSNKYNPNNLISSHHNQQQQISQQKSNHYKHKLDLIQSQIVELIKSCEFSVVSTASTILQSAPQQQQQLLNHQIVSLQQSLISYQKNNSSNNSNQQNRLQSLQQHTLEVLKSLLSQLTLNLPSKAISQQQSASNLSKTVQFSLSKQQSQEQLQLLLKYLPHSLQSLIHQQEGSLQQLNESSVYDVNHEDKIIHSLQEYSLLVSRNWINFLKDLLSIFSNLENTVLDLQSAVESLKNFDIAGIISVCYNQILANYTYSKQPTQQPKNIKPQQQSNLSCIDCSQQKQLQQFPSENGQYNSILSNNNMNTNYTSMDQVDQQVMRLAIKVSEKYTSKLEDKVMKSNNFEQVLNDSKVVLQVLNDNLSQTSSQFIDSCNQLRMTASSNKKHQITQFNFLLNQHAQDEMVNIRNALKLLDLYYTINYCKGTKQQQQVKERCEKNNTVISNIIKKINELAKKKQTLLTLLNNQSNSNNESEAITLDKAINFFKDVYIYNSVPLVQQQLQQQQQPSSQQNVNNKKLNLSSQVYELLKENAGYKLSFNSVYSHLSKY